ncbi:MAG: type transport system ATP-binding protein [Actinomycetota bacterium]|jgi:ABC-2 type transport system ATP-binding protein
MLQVDGVSKSYASHQALRDVSFEVAPGEIVAILGPNGAGKSTLMSLIVGLLKPDIGSVTIGGVDPTRMSQSQRSGIGFAPQELGLYPSATVEENLQYFAGLTGAGKKAVRRMARDAAEVFRVEDLFPRRISTLSGGEKRRVHSAIALVARPRLLLLDEPTVGVDVGTRREVIAAVRQLADDGVAVCYSTHYLPEVETLAARVVLLHHGRKVVDGPLAEMWRNDDRSRITFTFDGEAPLLQGTERKGDTLQIEHVGNPGEFVAVFFRSHAHELRNLKAVEIERPSLEDLLIALAPDLGTPGGEIK